MSKRKDRVKKYDTEGFYEMVGRLLTKYKESENLSDTEIGKAVGEQHGTIRSIAQGKRFQAHHLVWLLHQGIFASDDIEKLHELFYGDDHGEEESSEEVSLDLFI